MIFSKLGSSIARSSRSKGLVYGGGVRSVILSEGRLRASPALEAAANQVESGLGFLRRHFASLATRKGLVTDDLSRLFANPRLRQFFSSEIPKKKNYVNYYPKDAKQAPKNEQKSESRGEIDDDMEETVEPKQKWRKKRLLNQMSDRSSCFKLIVQVCTSGTDEAEVATEFEEMAKAARASSPTLSLIVLVVQVKNPQRDLPIGIGLALLVCCALYMMVSIVIVGLVPYHAMDPDTPISSAFQVIMGRSYSYSPSPPRSLLNLSMLKSSSCLYRIIKTRDKCKQFEIPDVHKNGKTKKIKAFQGTVRRRRISAVESLRCQRVMLD